MSSTIEDARDAIEHAEEQAIEKVEAAEEKRGQFATRVAIMVSVLAAALALGEMQEKGAQNEYMARHIQVSDDYAYYQAKTVRSELYALHADVLAALPNASDPAVQKQIAASRAESARLLDDPMSHGTKQLLERAKAEEEAREAQLHRYESFEGVVGALQIAIVLASVSIVTRVGFLAIAAGLAGLGAIIGGVLIYTSAI